MAAGGPGFQLGDAGPGKMRAIVNGVEQPAFAYIDFDSIHVSADGSTLAYFASDSHTGEPLFAVHGAKRGPTLGKRPADLFLSADGRHVAYTAPAEQRPQRVLYIDHRPVGTYFKVGAVAFAPDGRALWAAADVQPAVAKKGTFDIYFTGGKRVAAGFAYVGSNAPDVPARGAVNPPQAIFSPNGEHWAVRGRTFAPGGAGGMAVIADGTLQETHPDVVDGSLQYAPDGRTLIYAAGILQPPAYQLYRNGRPDAGVWNFIRGDSISSSADGKQVAFKGFLGESGSYPHGMPQLVVDGKVRVKDVGRWAFSPDFRHVLATQLVVADPATWDRSVDRTTERLLFDGKAIADWKAAFNQHETARLLSVSPDGRHWIALAGMGSDPGPLRLYLDGREAELSGGYTLTDPQWKPDGSVILTAVSGRAAVPIRIGPVD